MGRSGRPSPTDAELAILQVLWDRGPCTVRQVHEALKRRQSTGYTTKLKIMQIMAEKKLVTRDESTRSHVYRAAISKNQTQRQVVKDMIEKVFGGSSTNLVMRALATKQPTEAELKQVRKLLEGYSREY